MSARARVRDELPHTVERELVSFQAELSAARDVFQDDATEGVREEVNVVSAEHDAVRLEAPRRRQLHPGDKFWSRVKLPCFFKHTR